MTLDEVVEKISSYGIDLVELTGGEPLAQPAAFPLMDQLLKKGFKVLVETGGSEPIAAVPKGVHVIMDIKCPDSLMDSKNLPDNLNHLKESDEIKFVVASRKDFDWAVQHAHENSLWKRCLVNFSPAWGLVNPKDLSDWMVHGKIEGRLNLQIHKYIWSPKAKGV